MHTIRCSISVFCLSLFSLTIAFSQEVIPSVTQASTVIVTATATQQRVRYASLGEVHQTRLQVFSVDGSQVFDSSFRLGNLIDWKLSDQQGQHLPDGSYLFLITTRDFAEHLTQKYGTATLEQGQVYLEQTSRDELPLAQTTVLEANQQTEIISTIDRVGAAGLNADAASQGKDTTTSQSTSGTVNISGTGTQNRIAKWIDSAGTLGDSNIFSDSAGNVGIGTNAPGGQLHIFGTAGQDVFAGMGPDLINGPALNFGYAGSSFGRGAGFFNVRPDASAAAPNPSLRFATANVQRMIITNTGNVGIGTLDPQARLEVVGSLAKLPNNVTLAVGTQGNQVQFGAPNGETGMSISGTSGRADVRFDGQKLSLVVGQGGSGPPSAASGLTVDRDGHVVIGADATVTGTSLYVANGANTSSIFAQATGVGHYGVWAVNTMGTSVLGQTDSGVGLEGTSNSGPALRVTSNTGVLAEGFSASNPNNRVFHINLNGTYVAGSDFAESLPVYGNRSNLEAGDVLVMSMSLSGSVQKSRRPFDTRVAGVYSTRPGLLGAEKDGATRIDPGEVPVAIVGIVPTKVSAENGSIRVGDLLTTSQTPGYAMRCDKKVKCIGAIVGKAIESLPKGRGLIKVLVTLR